MESIYEDLRTASEAEAVARIYPELEKISIDYGIMEKASDVYCIPAEFGWNDVGSWDALDSVFSHDGDDNVIVGDFEGIDTENTIIFNKSSDKLITAIGVKDLIVVQTEDSILICSKDRTQDVKLMVDRLKEQGREDLL